MSIKEIFCQDKAIDILQRAFASDRWAHAYIFAGVEGVGKFKTACEWAKLLLCEEPIVENDFADSCGSCKSCRPFEADSHPDFNHIYKELLEFTKDGKGKASPLDLPIDVIREFLVEKVSNRPTLSKSKVFVVGEAERLNNSSQNCLLKVLEEPPEYCSIIMLCTRLEKLLPTIKSRAQIIRFGPIDEEKIIDKLQQAGIDEIKARYFARLGGGSLGLACQWANLELADADLYESKKELIRQLCSYDITETLNLAQELLDKSKQIAATWTNLDKDTSRKDINRKALKTIVQIIISVMYDVMNLNARTKKDIINFDQHEQVKEIAGRLDSEQAAEKISDCYKALLWIESNVNERLIFEQLLLNLTDSDRIKV
ncbi:MAG: DNA polymerase III subunit delta' C-terminal domain-containing protein [Phycisphaerales bacterium]|jgi:DNA polymerase-3 subunit delta'